MDVKLPGRALYSLPDIIEQLDVADEYFWTPQRLVAFEHWVGHIPFAFWLIKVLRPRRVVELGVHRGNSYCAFCQAVSALQLNTQIFGVDTWQGDVHMAREHGLFEELSVYHDSRYGEFSTLLQMTFDDARLVIEDNSIDLLHVDGAHTFEAVRHDFENWRSALSDRAIVLFHDINVRRDNFGVWRLWEQLRREFPSFEFHHSYGLGVIGIGSNLPPAVRRLFEISDDEMAVPRVRALFASRGEAHVARLAEARLAQAAREHEARLSKDLQEAGEREDGLRDLLSAERNNSEALVQMTRELRDQIQHFANEIMSARATLNAIELSTMWRMTRPLRHTMRLVPPRARLWARRALKAAWWTITLQLPERLTDWRRARRGGAALAPQIAAATHPAFPAPAVPLMRQGPFLELPDLSACRAISPRGRIAVVVHVHFPEVWPEIEDALHTIEEAYDLFISLTDKAGTAIVEWIRANHPDALVYRFPNHGRDILPFLAFAGTGVLNRYELVCKLHSKRSIHIKGGDHWRKTLVRGVLRDQAQVREILRAFDTDPDLGIVVADGNIYGDHPLHWRDNVDRALELGQRIGISTIPNNALFPGGSIYWIRPFLLRTLAALDVTSADFEPEPIRVDGASAHAVERLVGVVCADAGMRIATTTGVMSSVPVDVSQPETCNHLIAYYLPQFHPIPENDEWWGKGFTEWTNVTRATPQFRGHRQPRLPTELGFYDLRLPGVQEAQAELARKYGLSAFCYYYYWFDGRSILRRPLDDMLASGSPDFPFLLCWANEPWSRNWDGGSRETLLPQTYGEDWPEAFARDIAPALSDPRYFRLEGRPVLLIYRVMHVPAASNAFKRLRAELRRLGVGEIHLGGGWVSFPDDPPQPTDPRDLNLDAYFAFPPHKHHPGSEITNQMTGLAPDFSGHIYSYDSMIEVNLSEMDAIPGHRGVMLGWDNTARRMQRANIVHGATPAKFRRWLRGVLRSERSRPGKSDRLIFINAWNEWAEGTYLEPDQVYGHGWLEAVKSAAAEPLLTSFASSQTAPAPSPGPTKAGQNTSHSMSDKGN